MIDNESSLGKGSGKISRRTAIAILPFLAGTFSIATACSADASTPTQAPNSLNLAPKSNMLTPESMEKGAYFYLYAQGAVINLTKGVDIAIMPDNLQRINNDSRYGINLGPQEQNITYLFPQRSGNQSDREKAIKMAEDELPLVMLALQQAGIDRGRLRFSIIFVGDVSTRVSKQNPNMRVQTDTFRTALGFELGNEYLVLTRRAIFDASQTPSTISHTPQDRSLLAQTGSYPLLVTSINPAYLAALGLGGVRI